MKFPVLWSGLCCYIAGWDGKCSEILAMIKLFQNPRVNKVFISCRYSDMATKLSGQTFIFGGIFFVSKLFWEF